MLIYSFECYCVSVLLNFKYPALTFIMLLKSFQMLSNFLTYFYRNFAIRFFFLIEFGVITLKDRVFRGMQKSNLWKKTYIDKMRWMFRNRLEVAIVTCERHMKVPELELLRSRTFIFSSTLQAVPENLIM